MPTFNTNTTLATNSTIPSGATRPIGTAVYIDTEGPTLARGFTSPLTNNDVFNLSVGTIINAGNTLTLSPTVGYIAAPLSLRAGASSTDAGAVLRLNSARMTTPIIGTPRNDGTNISDTSRPQIILREGSQLIMPKSAVDAFAATHFSASLSFDVVDSAIIGPINSNTVVADTEFYLGIRNSNLYLGHNSTFRDCQLVDFIRYELQDNFVAFSGVDIIYTNNVGSSGTGGTILSAAAPNLHTFFDGVVNVTFLSNNKPDSFKYFGMNIGLCSHTFRASVPSDVYGFQTLFSSAGAGGNNSCYADIYYEAPITIDMSCARSNGNIEAGTGRFVFWNADNEKVVDQILANGSFSADQRYRWYSLAHRSFNSNRIGQGNILSSVAPVGWPDARTDTDAMHIIDGNNANFATQAGVIFGTDTDATVVTATSTQEKYYRQATRRGWPFTQGYIQWECFPFFQSNIGATTALTGTGDPTKAQVDAAEAAPALIRSSHAITSRVTQDPAINLTEAAAAALTGITPTVTSSNELNLTITGANTTPRNVYNYTAKWALDNFANNSNYVYTMPTQPTTGYFPSSSAASVNTAPGFAGTNEIGFSANTTNFNTSVANGAAWTDLQGLVTGSGRRIYRENGTNFREMYTGVAIVWNSATRWALLEFFREQGLVSSGNRDAARITRVIASAGTIDTSATYHVGSSLNEYGTDVVRTEPIIDYLQTVELAPLVSNGAIMNLNRTNLLLSTNGTLNSTDTVFNTFNLDANSSINTNSTTLNYNVTGSGEVNGLPTITSDINAIADGVTIGSGVTLNFAGGSSYFIAGDISAATLVRTGTGTVNLIVVGNGSLPSVVSANFVHQKEVTVSFIAPGTNTWDSDNFDSEEIINIESYNGPSQTGINPVQPQENITGVINRGPINYGLWIASETGEGGATALLTQPNSWDWRNPDNAEGRVNAGLVLGLSSATEASTAQTYLNSTTIVNKRVIATDSTRSNYAVFSADGTTTTVADNSISIQDLTLIGSQGVPVNNLTFYIGVDTAGNAVDITEGAALAAPTATLSNSGRTLNYTYRISPNDNLYYAFAARNGASGNWYNPVVGNSELTNTPSHDITSVASSIIPTSFTNGTGLSAMEAYINNGDNAVIELMHQVPDDSDHMQITVNNAQTVGTDADGRYIHRLIQQKNNFLHNVATGFYPINGWVIEQDQIQYNNRFVEWVKSAASDTPVEFPVSVVDSGGNSLNSGTNSITSTTNVRLQVAFNPAATTAFVPSAQLDDLAQVLENTEQILDNPFI